MEDTRSEFHKWKAATDEDLKRKIFRALIEKAREIRKEEEAYLAETATWLGESGETTRFENGEGQRWREKWEEFRDLQKWFSSFHPILTFDNLLKLGKFIEPS